MELHKFFSARNTKNRKEETRYVLQTEGKISPDNSSQGAFWGRGEMSQSKTDILLSLQVMHERPRDTVA